MTAYLFLVDNEGRIVSGQALPGWVNGSAEVWNAQNRSFYDAENQRWLIYEPLTVNAPTAVPLGATATLTVILPEGSPDTEVTVRVGEQESPIAMVDGQAAIDITFDTPGERIISVFSKHHGFVEVTITVVSE